MSSETRVSRKPERFAQPLGNESEFTIGLRQTREVESQEAQAIHSTFLSFLCLANPENLHRDKLNSRIRQLCCEIVHRRKITVLGSLLTDEADIQWKQLFSCSTHKLR